jgi:DNA-binding response OmpR family regulator
MARILIVDDETNIRTMIRMALMRAGHEVGQAADGPDGLAQFGNGRAWDLVLLDQRMPGMEGLEVLAAMLGRNPDARVIMVTAFGTVDLAVKAMKAGAKDFLRKPFTLDTLRGAVQAVLDGTAQEAPQAVAARTDPTTYGFATLNGFRIESHRQPARKLGADSVYDLTVRNPAGEAFPCAVVLPGYIVELILAHLDRDEAPGGERFWYGVCEEALANHLWQTASAPPDGTLVVDEFTSALRRWTDAVTSAQR